MKWLILLILSVIGCMPVYAELYISPISDAMSHYCQPEPSVVPSDKVPYGIESYGDRIPIRVVLEGLYPGYRMQFDGVDSDQLVSWYGGTTRSDILALLRFRYAFVITVGQPMNTITISQKAQGL